MRFVLTRDLEQFAARAERMLAARIECNVMATILINLRASGGREGSPLFAFAPDPRGGVLAAAMRTSPWPLLTSPLDADAAAELIQVWLAHDPDIPGVVGVPSSARAIAAAWQQCTSGLTHLGMRQAMHELDVARDPPRRALGALRPGQEAERDILIEWMGAFAREAGLPAGGDAERLVSDRLLHGRLAVWDHRGPVSMVGVQPPVAGVVRIGPVYTPPQHRRRGYAGTAVADCSRLALERGAQKCILFTDLANPTSNKIYAEVGFRRTLDWEEHVFEPPAAGRPQ